MPHSDLRTIRRALGVLERLPHEALADLTERLVDRLDAAEPDPDSEPEEDCCEAGECGGAALRNDCLPGDLADAEPDADDEEARERRPRRVLHRGYRRKRHGWGCARTCTTW